jgi:hypothetical protein
MRVGEGLWLERSSVQALRAWAVPWFQVWTMSTFVRSNLHSSSVTPSLLTAHAAMTTLHYPHHIRHCTGNDDARATRIDDVARTAREYKCQR